MPEMVEKDALILTQYQVVPTPNRDGVVLILYGDDAAGQLAEIATVVMHPDAADALAEALFDARVALIAGSAQI